MDFSDGVDDEPCKFAIWTKAPEDSDRSEILYMTASTEDTKKEWISALKTLLQSQKEFASGKLPKFHLDFHRVTLPW